MDTIYGSEVRQWVSEIVPLKDYFEEFDKTVTSFLYRDRTEPPSGSKPPAPRLQQDRLKKILTTAMAEEEAEAVIKSCNTDQLKLPDELTGVDVDYFIRRPALFELSKIPQEALDKLSTLRHLKERKNADQPPINLKYKNSIWLGKNKRSVVNLRSRKEFVITVRVYQPFKHVVGTKGARPPRCSQELMFLGDQYLTLLRDTIVCSTDLSVPGDFSDRPDQSQVLKAKDIYKSGFIFIENTFYNDMRNSTCKDYSAVIRDWASSRGIEELKSAQMEKTKFKDLNIRLGYPYVYQHQGNCEHLIVFADARLIHKSDTLSAGEYPLVRSVGSRNTKYCMVCSLYNARWVTRGNERTPSDPCYFCDTCFKGYNYVGGKKVGQFKAHPFYDRTVL